jgi:hypothetical protein
MVGVGLLVWASQLIAQARWTWTVAILVFCNIWGLATVAASWLPDNKWTLNRRLTNRLAWFTALVTAGTVFAWGIASLKGGPFYGTDEIAFNQYAAQLVQHGLNPYTHSMRPAFQLFQTPTSYYTYSFSGNPVTTLSYPSLSFLVYVPFLLLGWSYNLAPTLCILAWAIGTVMMFALLPKRSRPVALLFGGTALYASYALGGVTDAMYMPLLLIAAYKWDRFGSNWRTYIGPVVFGLAMSIKQTPWTVLPFVVVALACDEYVRTGMAGALRRGGKYLAVAIGVFLVPNLPWIIASPHAWLKGTLTPLFANLVPTGQGTVSLSLYMHLGGGSTTAFTAATAFALILLLVAFIGTYPAMRPLLFMLSAFVFLFGARSNVNYFISMLPIALVAAVTCGAAPQRRFASSGASRRLNGHGLAFDGRRIGLGRLVGPAGAFRSRGWAAAIAVCALLFLAAVVRSLTAAPPIGIKLTGIQTTGNTNHIDLLRLRVTNRSNKAVSPAFDILQNEYNSTFWRISQGPAHLAPNSAATYQLQARDAGAEPSIYSSFEVVGYLSHPNSFSVSPGYQGNLMTVAFKPTAIDRSVPVGQPTAVTVQLFKSGGPRLRRAGVPISLRSVTWNPTGPSRAALRIDGAKAGNRVSRKTNAQGEAVFTVVGVKPSGVAPVSLSAFLWNPRFKFVYGNSGTLNIRFVGH